eukprot:TRINITY_DN19499_c0_g1_i1.p1 TRINITY_DN19499_c0_g1~~TRINITY_DN19499_c0_g1_i1.p1  ORF type:complete len:576 (+),score=233.92 TRINITY_DN19499_c0_g1_i1:87-1730(+)
MSNEHGFAPSVFQSQVEVGSDAYEANRKQMTELVTRLQQTLASWTSEGKAKDIARHRKRGQLTLRDRLSLLLDEDSPWLELLPLVGYGQKDCPATNMGGIGLVCGVECMVAGSVPTIKGGTSNEMAVTKGLRLQQIALENGLPIIQLTQSGGADLTQQEKVFHRGGSSFYNQAKLSANGNTQVCVVFGSSTAGGAYQPGMSDYSIMVQEKAAVYLGGPPLVKMATGEVATDEELGGAVMHSVKSGVSDFLAEDEYHGIRIAREIIAHTQHRPKRTPYPPTALQHVDPPAYPEEDLLGIFDGDIRKPFDMSEVIARVVDGSRITFFKSEYGRTVVCCWARIHGFPVGIIGNNGVLMPDATQKATQFIDRCSREATPIIFFQNITGFMVGTQAEQEGIIKWGSLLINAVSNAPVPLLTVLIGASYGAGNYAMCGRAYNPRFLFSWPCSKCGVMGSQQLAGVLDIVGRRTMEARKLPAAAKKQAEKMLEQRKAQFEKAVEKTIDPYFTSSRALDDAMIDPRDTRTVLGFCLSVIHNTEVRGGVITGVSRL